MKKLAFSLDANALQSFEVSSDFVSVRALSANVAKSFAKPLAVVKQLFSTNFVAGDSISFGNLKLTAVTSSPTAVQFVPSGTLALTLAALIVTLQAGIATSDVALKAGTLDVAGTFLVTDTNTAITFTQAKLSKAVQAASVKASGTNTLTQTDGARFCRLSAGALFYYNSTSTATTGASDTTAGEGSISVPATVQPMFSVDDISAISVIAPSIIAVSAEWWS